MKQLQTHKEPYNLLFCLGFVSSLMASLYWTLFEFQWISFYPKQAHGELMIFGFLMAFISGFLMTAVPRMTGSIDASPFEVRAAGTLIVLQWFVCGTNHSSASIFIFVLQTLVLIAFFIRRLDLKKQLLPDGFIFIPFAFTSALLGSGASLASHFGVFDPIQGSRWLLIWTSQAFVLNLICGLGSRLIPVLSRLPQALPMTNNSSKPSLKKMLPWAFLLNLTFALETLGHDRVGLSARALWVLAFAIHSLGLLKTPSTSSYLGWGLKSGVLLIIAGYGLAATFPSQQLNFLHLVFIGGFSLMTFMVATRVVLAHGGQSTDLELTSRVLPLVTVLFLLSGAARAFVYPFYWHQGLLLGVGAFVFAVSLWMLYLGRFTFSR